MKWPCCAGTLLQSVADFPLNAYFFDARGVYVNLYGGSEVRWKANGAPVMLTQTTEYPESEQITIRIALDSPADFALRLRIPGWLQKQPEIALNGKAVKLDARPGSFATLVRRWREGDTVELRLPFPFRAAPIEERAHATAAMLRGPVMLVAVNPPADLAATSSALVSMKPAAGAPLKFDCESAAGPVRLRPFYRVQHEPYTTYFRRT